MAASASVGPLILAAALDAAFPDAARRSWRWPFHKEPLVGGATQSFGLHLIAGLIVAVLPIYHLVQLGLGVCAVCAP